MPTLKPTLLVVDDERQILESVRRLFRRTCEVWTASTARQGLEMLAEKPADLILCDQRMPDIAGDEFLSRARELAPDSVRILFTGYADIEAVIQAVNRGKIFGYVTKPWNTTELEALIQQAARHFELSKSNRVLATRLQEANQLLEEKVALRTRELAELESYQESLLASLGSGVVVVDMSGTVTSFNPAAAAFLGLGPEQVLGRRFAEVEALEPFAEELQRSLASGEPGSYQEARLQLADGQSRFLGFSVNPLLVPSGQRRGAIVNCSDITEKRLMELQLTQAEKLSTIGQLAGGVAHEINNPLGVILGFTQILIRQSQQTDQNQRRLQNIERQALRCKEIVTNLLKFARRPRMDSQSVQLNTVVEETLALMGRQFEVEGIRLSTALEPGLPVVAADPNELEQIIFNLVMNARDALAQGGELSIETRQSGGTVEVIVADTGSGVPASLRDKIFDPFFTTKEAGQGTGLGLSVSRGIARRHGGELLLDSQPGGGSRFVLRLPVPATPPPSPTVSPAAETSATAVPALRILVVDDELDIRQLCIDYFSEASGDVVAVENGVKALEEASRRSFDLVLLDVMMPGLDGIATLEQMRARGLELPVIVMTGRINETVVANKERLRILDILEKPFSINELDRVLSRLQEVRRG